MTGPEPASSRPMARRGVRRVLAARYRRLRPWFTPGERLENALPGRPGAFVRSAGWLFCREPTLLLFAFTFAFLLSIFPLIVLLVSFTAALPIDGFHDTFLLALEQFFPVSQEWIVRNLTLYIKQLGIYQVVALVLLAWAGSALFFALEAALESAYRVKAPRNFVGSQIIGTALVLALGALALLAAGVLHFVTTSLGHLRPDVPAQTVFVFSYYVLAFIVVSCLMCFAFHWLPNRSVAFRKVLPEAFFATALILAADQLFRSYAPSMQLEDVYGPFYISVTILLWGYTFGCIIVGTARLGANGFFSGELGPTETPQEPSSGTMDGDGQVAGRPPAVTEINRLRN